MSTVRFVFLINPGSGSVNDGRIKTLHAAIKAHHLDAEVILAGDDIEAQATRLQKRGHEAIIAAGGDGTLRAVAAALVGTKTAFGVLPWGTFNHFAKALEVPDDLDVIFGALKEGKRRTVDTGEAGGMLFLNNASMGVYPHFVIAREKKEKAWGKFPAAIVASLKMLVRYRTVSLTLTIDGETTNVITPLVFIGNNDYQIDRLGLVARENVDRGELCVYTLNSAKRIDIVKLAWRAGIGTTRSMEMFNQSNPAHLKVDSPRSKSILIALDGEVEKMTLPVEIEVKRRSLILLDAREISA